jgi:acid phosphatase
MITNTFLRFTIGFIILCNGFFIRSSAYIPNPDHVVVLVLENTSFSEIVDSNVAVYIKSLINDPYSALFTQSYGMSRPSQPNYLQMFSGSTQGVTSNNLPQGLPFITSNLGAQIIAASKTFTGFCEDLPYAGYTGEYYAGYARKHNPWVNWQGSPLNGLPVSVNQPFTSFPTDFNLLPHLSVVVPNNINSMHDGVYPTRISIADTWIQNNLNAYIQWAKTRNSLFILTFDEDNFFNQRIATLFLGPMVQHGSYSNYFNHYNLLRLLEDIFNLSPLGGATSAAPTDFCWTSSCNYSALVTENGPWQFCSTGNITLTASPANSYLWSNGATTQSITVNTTGNYFVTEVGAGNCSKTSNTIIVSATQITSVSPASSPAGSTVVISGSNLSGVTSVKFNGISASFTIASSTKINAVVPASATGGFITLSDACGNFTSPFAFTVAPVIPAIAVKLFIEGYYTASGQMVSVIGNGNCDTITVELHDSISPYGLIYSTKGVINTKGNGLFYLPASVNGKRYFLAAYARNTLKTWSSSAIRFSNYTTFDFASAFSQVYGDNLKRMIDGNFALISGDVTSDDIINISDFTSIKNSTKIFQNGYLPNDLNGDKIVDSTDFSLVENNLLRISLHP